MAWINAKNITVEESAGMVDLDFMIRQGYDRVRTIVSVSTMNSSAHTGIMNISTWLYVCVYKGGYNYNYIIITFLKENFYPE